MASRTPLHGGPVVALLWILGGGWFIVTATLPTGQVSNHYEADHWDLFNVPEVQRAPEWDGHTPAEAADRLSAALRTPTEETKP